MTTAELNPPEPSPAAPPPAAPPNAPRPDLAKIVAPGPSNTRLIKWIAGGVVAVIVGGVGYKLLAPHAAPTTYVFGRVTRGRVVETVEATGALQAELQVQVGAQVSGRIVRLHADYNSQVHQGDLLAELDPAPYRSQVDHETASVQSAEDTLAHSQADLALAERNYARAVSLRAANQNAVSDLDTARDARDAARAQVGVSQAMIAQAHATLATAQTNLEYTHIFSPIDGIVISRSVDVGQTVAASLQAPVLFEIANDLSRMQAVAAVDESDIGQLHQGQAAEVRVDAFPNQRFPGTVTQIRYQATTTSGVVTYPAVVEVANAALQLRPGMTATVRIVSNQHDNVLRVPNAALRYQPSNVRSSSVGQMGTAASDDDTVGEPAGTPTAAETGRVWVLRNGAPAPITVHLGLTDGTVTEVTGDGLSPSTQVIIDDTSDQGPSTTGGGGGGSSGSPNPFGGGGSSGGGRSRRMP